jgi:hypothetical protein
MLWQGTQNVSLDVSTVRPRYCSHQAKIRLPL